MDLKFALILAAIIVVILYFWYKNYYEGFDTKQQKANALIAWWQTKRPTYEKYKRDLPNSDIVEYNLGKALKFANKLTNDNLENIISG